MNQLPDKHKDTLSKLIQSDMLDQPSDKFTDSVLQRLGISHSPVAIKYEPIINRTGWVIVLVITAVLIYLALSGSSGASLDANALIVQSAIQNTTSIFEQLLTGSVALLLATAAFAVFLLFGAESLYRQSRLKTA